MFGSVTIEIAIGLIVVFILMSTICAAIREGIESMLKTRAAYLEQGIRQLLNDRKGDKLASDLFNHPLIFGLFNGDYSPGQDEEKTRLLAKGKNLPSYIPSKNFARALMDIAAKGADVNAAVQSTAIVSLDGIRDNVSKINNPQIQRVLLNAVDMAQGDLDKAQANIENWYNSAMDRVSGWYKRSTQWIILVISLFVTVVLNVDSLKIINYLANNETARQVIVEKAEKLDKDTAGQDGLTYEAAQAQLEKLGLPIGWGNDPVSTSSKSKSAIIFSMVLGWLITALAATLGTPYWFDILNKVMVIRSTVKPHEKSLEEGSQDAQPKTPQVVYVNPQAGNGTANGIAGTVAQGHNHDDGEADGCDLPFDSLTADEDLPEAKGGVQ